MRTKPKDSYSDIKAIAIGLIVSPIALGAYKLTAIIFHALT